MRKTFSIKNDNKTVLRFTLSGEEKMVSKALKVLLEDVFHRFGTGEQIANEIYKPDETKDSHSV